MKRIIITGASGLVATELTVKLLAETDASLYLLSTQPEKLKERYTESLGRVFCFTLDTFAQYVKENEECFDVCIHTAFSRSVKGDLIAESLNYQQKLLSILKTINLKVFANVSSQSVYGKMSDPLWTEATPVDPDYLYAMGKYTSEIITELMLNEANIKWTNLRLCSVCEYARFVRIFVQNAIEGKPINLTAANQQCSFIQVQDVADALMKFITTADDVNLDKVYNLGANIVNTIGEVAQKVKTAGEERYGLSNIEITQADSANPIFMGMDATSFMKTFGWSPKRNMDDMIVEMFEMLLDRQEGDYPKSFKLVYNY